MNEIKRNGGEQNIFCIRYNKYGIIQVEIINSWFTDNFRGDDKFRGRVCSCRLCLSSYPEGDSGFRPVRKENSEHCVSSQGSFLRDGTVD